jgi:hypothetical protein
MTGPSEGPGDNLIDASCVKQLLSEKTANLSRKALEHTEAVLGGAPEMGAPAKCCFVCTPWPGFSGAALVSALLSISDPADGIR